MSRNHLQCRCGRRYLPRPGDEGRTIRCRCGALIPIPVSGKRITYPIPLSRKYQRLADTLIWGYLAGVVVAVGLLWGLGDHWWPATVLLYGPRWFLAPVLGVTLVIALLFRPRLLGAVIVSGLLLWGPWLGGRWSFSGSSSSDALGSLRLITFNMMGGGNTTPEVVIPGLLRFRPDVIGIQECNIEALDTTSLPRDWTLHTHSRLCFLSRLPVDSVVALEEVRTALEGGTGTAVLYRMIIDAKSLWVGVLHLETARKGMERLRASGDLASMNRNILIRQSGASRASTWLSRNAPDGIYLGDFNMPVESRIYRRNWASCQNAFSVAGRGFGYTRFLPQFSIRIDHVLSCGDAPIPTSAVVGPDLGSDHRPLIVDYRWRM